MRKIRKVLKKFEATLLSLSLGRISMRTIFGWVLGGVFISALSCPSLWAQATAQISGTVKDQSGAVLPGVEIKVTQTETGVGRDAVTNETGSYVLTNLPIGPYRLEASLPGFRTYAQTGLVLEVNASPTINVVLAVGQVSEQVEVQANAAQVETRSAGVGTVMENTSILELPLNGRNMIDLVSIGPATASATLLNGTGGRDPFTQGNVSVAGGINSGLNYTLDGAFHINPYTNSYAPMPFPDALQEFKVETGATGIQSGVKPSGTVSLVTKQGTNQWHGDAFEFVRNFAFNARNAFAVGNDGLKRNQFGGTVGGPIVKNKLFFFTGYQQTLVRQTPVDSSEVVPTAAMLTGDFTAYTSPACNGGRQITIKAPFAGNRVDPKLFSPAALNLTKALHLSTDPCGTILTGIPTATNDYQGIARADYQRSANNSIFIRYFADQIINPSPYDITHDPLNAEDAAAVGLGQAFTVGDTYLFGANVVNAFRLTANRIATAKSPASYANAGLGPADIGIHAFSYYPHRPGVGTVTGAFNFSNLGGPANGYTNGTIFGASDDLSVVRGNHQLTFGGQFNVWKTNSLSNNRSTMSTTSNGSISGSAMADFFLGNVSSFQNGTDASYDILARYLGLYVGDTWKVNQKLTLSYGLRWEPYFPQVHTEKFVFHFDHNLFTQGVKSNQFPTAPPGLVFPGDPGFPGLTGMYKKWTDFSPRLGLGWDVNGDGRTSVRASVATFYDFPPTIDLQGFGNGAPFTNVYARTGVNLDNPWANEPGGDPFPVYYGRGVWSNPTKAVFPAYGNVLTEDYNTPNMRVLQWNLGVQRQVSDWLVSATYMGNETTHLWTLKYTNPAIPLGFGPCTINSSINGVITSVPYSTCSTIANTNQRRALSLENPASGLYYGPQQKIDPGGTASFSGLLLGIQRRGRVTVGGNYTYSHCITDPNVNQPLAVGGTEAYSNPYSRRFDRGNCTLQSVDVRHAMKMSAVIVSPQFSNRGLRAVASGWTLAPIFKAATGDHLAIGSGQDSALNGGTGSGTGGFERASQILGNPYGNKTANSFLNPAAFQLPALGTLGNIGAGSIEGPGSWDIDAGLTRSFQVREGQKLDLRFEAFNVLNHFRMMDPNATFGSPLLGRVTQAMDPRIWQFALKYVF